MAQPRTTPVNERKQSSVNTRTNYTDNSWNSFNWRLPARADRLLLLRLLGLTLTLASIAPAQDYRVLKSFGALTNGSGYSPQAPLVQGPDGTLYGTTGSGDWPVMRSEEHTSELQSL